MLYTHTICLDFFMGDNFSFILWTILLETHDNALLVNPKHGGHLGFFQKGFFTPDPLTWLDKAALQYAEAIVTLYVSNKLPHSKYKSWCWTLGMKYVIHVYLFWAFSSIYCKHNLLSVIFWYLLIDCFILLLWVCLKYFFLHLFVFEVHS